MCARGGERSLWAKLLNKFGSFGVLGLGIHKFDNMSRLIRVNERVHYIH